MRLDPLNNPMLNVIQGLRICDAQFQTPGGIIPFRWAASSRYDGRLGQKSASPR